MNSLEERVSEAMRPYPHLLRHAKDEEFLERNQAVGCSQEEGMMAGMTVDQQAQPSRQNTY